MCYTGGYGRAHAPGISGVRVTGDVAVVRYTPTEKEQALDAYLRYGAAEAARRLDIPLRTLTSWAREEDLTTRVQDIRDLNEARRMLLADALLGDLHRLREQLFAQTTAIHWDEGELRQETIDQPTFQDKERIVRSMSLLADQISVLTGGKTAQAVSAVQVNIVREGAG